MFITLARLGLGGAAGENKRGGGGWGEAESYPFRSRECIPGKDFTIRAYYSTW